MNSATKLRWANILTGIASILPVIQTFLTNPPFTPAGVVVGTAVVTYATLLATWWKQVLSPDVSNIGAKVTIWIAIAATLTGLLDFLQVFHFTTSAATWIKWWITLAVTLINVYSKQLFPSKLQKERMRDLKNQ